MQLHSVFKYWFISHDMLGIITQGKEVVKSNKWQSSILICCSSKVVKIRTLSLGCVRISSALFHPDLVNMDSFSRPQGCISLCPTVWPCLFISWSISPWLCQKESWYNPPLFVHGVPLCKFLVYLYRDWAYSSYFRDLMQIHKIITFNCRVKF